MQITIPPIPPFLLDMGERAVKSFAGAMLTVLGAGALDSSFTSLPWMSAIDMGAGTTAVSILMSLASAQWGDKTASLVKAVSYTLTRPHALILPFHKAK